MASITLQSRLCKEIASLPEDATLSDVCRFLDPIVEEYVVDDHNSCTVLNDDGVTPLITSCDKANESCMEYILTTVTQNPSYAALFGDPFAKTSSRLGGNSAIHFAAMSGFTNAIQWMDQISNVLDIVDVDPFSSATNIHGDTCIMMACAGGHLSFLKQLWKKEGTDFKKNLKMQNKSRDSALSLACGHGHTAIMDFLLSSSDGPKMCVQHTDIENCKQKLNNADKKLLRINVNDETRKKYDEKRINLKRCLVMMQVTAFQASECSMQELIVEYNSKASTQKKVKKPSKKLILKSTTMNHTENLSTIDIQKKSQVAWMEVCKNKESLDQSIYASSYVTLSSGAVVKYGKCIENDEHLEDQPLREVKSELQKSADEMLRERYREPYIRQSQDAAIDSVMDSLCLKASMLLFTSHGMAMGLSPSQLEAIENILGNQLTAVKEAKIIQTRIRLQDS